jgi:hypothetical protein
MPILNYGSEVWGFIQGNSVERVHMQFCKRILGVKKVTQNDFVYGELGRISLKSVRYYNIVKFWLKILHTNENKYVKKVYTLLKNDFENFPNKTNWCSLVKHLLCDLGFYDAWLMQSVGNSDYFLCIVKQRLTDQFVQNWSCRLDNSSRALFYKQISDFKFQPYLNFIHVKRFCSSVTKLRVSSHRLHIETGRWTKPHSTPFNERTCFCCNVLEDEFHFVLECKLYSDIRKRLIPTYYWKRPNMLKLIDLLNTENICVARKFGKYVHSAFEIRKEKLYTNRNQSS